MLAALSCLTWTSWKNTPLRREHPYIFSRAEMMGTVLLYHVSIKHEATPSFDSLNCLCQSFIWWVKVWQLCSCPCHAGHQNGGVFGHHSDCQKHGSYRWKSLALNVLLWPRFALEWLGSLGSDTCCPRMYEATGNVANMQISFCVYTLKLTATKFQGFSA